MGESLEGYQRRLQSTNVIATRGVDLIVVDDERIGEIVNTLIRRDLSNLGIEGVECIYSDAPERVVAVLDFYHQYLKQKLQRTVLVTDFSMPEMTGGEVLSWANRSGLSQKNMFMFTGDKGGSEVNALESKYPGVTFFDKSDVPSLRQRVSERVSEIMNEDQRLRQVAFSFSNHVVPARVAA